MYTELGTPECGLEGKCSPFAMAAIAAACWPCVFLPKQVRSWLLSTLLPPSLSPPL